MHTETIKVWQCDFCGRSFVAKQDCLRHERAEHLCAVCIHSVPFGYDTVCELAKCRFKEDNRNNRERK